MTRPFRSLFQVSTLSCLLAGALAQTTSTEVVGTVTDSTGAVIPGGHVTLLRVETGERRQTTTTRTGDYAFPLIEIGTYSVTVEVAGFKTQTKTGIRVELQQIARVNVSLAIGETSERVEVVATGVELKTDDAVVGQVLDNRRISELPLNGRNIGALALLTPGVFFGSRQGYGFSGEDGGFVGGKIIALVGNGQRELNQQVTLDGVIATGSQVNVANLVPSVDSVQEMKVMTGSYSAEYGQNNGAIVQIAMKTGTNQFHGTLFELLRNNLTASKDYFLNFQVPATATLLNKPILRRNQYGAFLSGPVEIPKIYHGRNKTFWTFTYEAYRQTTENPVQTFWFPAEMRNGDFSKMLTPLIRAGKPVRAPTVVYDPATGVPWPGNILPASRINKAAADFVKTYLPLPQFQPEDYLDINVQGLVRNISVTDQYGFRIDHNINANNRVFVRYLTDKQSKTTGNINPNFTGYQYAWPTNVATQFLHIFNASMVNELRYGWNVIDDKNANPRTGTDFSPDSLGFGQWRVLGTRTLTPAETGIPATGILPGDSGNSVDINRTHQISDNLSISRASHTFKFGGEWRRPFLNVGASNNPRGFLTCCPGGYSLSGWLQGYASSSQTPEGYSFSEPRQNRISGYAQDAWKATRKLTINVGVRWDYFGLPTEPAGKWRTLSLAVLSKASDGNMYPTMIPSPNTPGYQFVQQEYRYLMPRIGLAYRLSSKWVIRAGSGWYANGQQLDNFQILSRNPPQAGTYSFFGPALDVAQTYPLDYGGQTYNIITQKFRPGIAPLTLDNPFPGQGTPAGASANVILMPYDNKQSSNGQWSFDLQRELPWQSVLTLAYVGSKTTHIDTSVHAFNDPNPVYLDTNFNARRPYPFYVSQGEDNVRRPLGQIRFLDDNSNGNYNSLQASLQKRYSAGMTLTANYVYGKALGEGYERNGGSPYQDPRNRRADRGRYPFDITQNFTTSFVYEPPFLKRFKGFVGGVIGGWQTSGVVTLRTGLPFNITNPSSGTLNLGDGTARPDRISSGSLGDQASRQLWYDPTAFLRTDCNLPGRQDLCHYGNSGNYILDMPGVKKLDLTVQKNWKIPYLGDQGRLQFRAEAYNATNTPVFGAPNNISYSSNNSVTPDAPRVGEIRSLLNPMRIISFGLKLYF